MNKKVIHSIIDHASEAYRERIAVEEPLRSISYGQLKDYSNAIAHNLINVGLNKGDVVGIYLASGINYVASILGINKAGGVFMPLELAYPIKRTEHILEKVQPSIIITEEAYVETIFGIYNDSSVKSSLKKLILISEEQDLIKLASIEDGKKTGEDEGTVDHTEVTVEVDGDDGNYLLYTSGSTGQPKIIEGCHKSLSHFIHWEQGEFELDEHVRVSQLAPLSFDVSLRDIFVPLLSGGTLCIPERNAKLEPAKLIRWIGRTQITLMHMVPSVFRLLTQALEDDETLLKEVAKLKYILLAGEALYGRDVIAWRNVVGNQTELVNLYGPTETTLAKIFNRIGPIIDDPNDIIPLGKPITNTAVIIISYGQLCSIGAIGEIYIKTPFRSKGYYKDEEQTKSRFVQNPLHNDHEDIVYKTGDLGRYQENKNIQFVGREDGQIKIRGNRVELSEVEKVIMEYPGAKHVVVVPIKKTEGEEVLSCYYTVELPVDEILLKRHVTEYLPDYMHPSYYVCMEEFPLNINGKIDKRALPRPEELLYEKLNYQGPSNELEEKIATIWSEVLGLNKVGVLNSFFELGGHSLTATRVVSRIYQELEKEISLKDFFDHPTIQSLSILLNSKSKSTFQSIEPVAEQAYYEVSHAQRRLWVTDQISGSIPYHMLGGCYINMKLDIVAFNKVFQTIVERHESLRTTFIEIDGEPKQKIHADINFQLAYYNLTDEPNKEDKASKLISSEQTTIFDLKEGPLLRSKLIQLEEEKYLFLFNVHHIISDGWSTAVLIKEILALYESYRKGEENPLSPLRIHYKDYAAWQNNLIQDATKNYQAYWHKKLGGDIPVLKLPTDYKRPEVKTYEGSKYSFTLSKDMSDDIRRVCVENDISLFMFFLAALTIKLYIMTDEKDVLIGCPIAGRNHPELENQIGFYLNNLVLRNEVDRTLTFSAFLSTVKKNTLEAFEYQEYPYDRLIEELKPDISPNRNAFYDVLLVMNNEGLNGDQDEMRQLGEMLEVSQLEMEDNTSKLDMSFFVNDDPQISALVEYSTELFREESISKMTVGFIKLLNIVLDDPEVVLGDVVWTLTNSNKEALLKKTMNEISDNF